MIEWMPLVIDAKRLCDANPEADQVIALETAGGKRYSFVNRRILSGDCSDEEQFLQMLRETGDTHVIRIVCLWVGIELAMAFDIPSYNFRMALIHINPENMETAVPVCGGYGHFVKRFKNLMPLKQTDN